MRPFHLTCSLVFSFLVLCGSNGFLIAQDASEPIMIPGKGPAYTEPPQEDPNYVLMGEFVGEVTADGQTKQVGLQIRPVGDGQFDAVSFLGGLPGQENFRGEPVRMIGRRSSDFVVLSGGPYAIVVDTDGCLLLDRTGEKVGRLERIDRSSPTLGAQPRGEATILFDGSGTEQFTRAEMTADGLLMEGADVKPMFQDFNLHVEFRLPYMPEANGQQRGNSGLYLQSRYECQVLDSFAQEPLINGCGALYKFKAPDLNMALPPLVWQTYDIQFTAPRWAADGTKIRDAHITSWLNGVKIQDNVALPNKTGAGKQEEPLLLPIRLQDHGDPVRFRNVWIVDRGLMTGEFPVYPTPEERAEAAKAKREQAEAEAKSAESDDTQENSQPTEPSSNEAEKAEAGTEKASEDDSQAEPTQEDGAEQENAKSKDDGESESSEGSAEPTE